MKRIDGESETFIVQETAHALRADGFDASEDGTGRGTPLVPVANTLAGNSGRCQVEQNYVPISFTNQAGDESSICSTLKSECHGALPMVAHVEPGVYDGWTNKPHRSAMAVRRLMPTECEALQGFPRNYTAIPYRGKVAADGPRYKALGNSIAVPCLQWIGKRIQAVEDQQ